jgi:crossover junction endodeoxyribonuclease RuvC
MNPDLKKIILGIDPGYGRVGVAIVEKDQGNDLLIHSECIETDSKQDSSARLLEIKNKIGNIIKKFSPTILAIETLLWSKNKKTALKVSEARGVIIGEASAYNLKIIEFNPNQVKLSITGYGKSDKKQVINMVKKILKIKDLNKDKKFDDEYDAIAIALTCSATNLSTFDN